MNSCLLTYCRLRKCYTSLFLCRKHLHQKAHQLAKQRGFQAVIGLEIHAQILAESKIFSGSGTKYGSPVNCQVAFMDCALPGTLPVLNRRCVEAGVKTALALNCHINEVSYFDRKHYFYADMPSGYQITQQRRPLACQGHLTYILNDVSHDANIHQIQLEQDSGKSLHDNQLNQSLIDLNRAGIGLMEIVTDPDFRSSSEARAFIKELQLLLLTLETCSCKMSEGKFRVDASVSLHRAEEALGTRCEVKNLNSVGFMEKAIDYEINRQLEILINGGEVENETRMFDAEKGETIPMRDKEKVHDYRFMPEPNLLPLRLYTDCTVPAEIPHSQVINIDTLRVTMPTLPMDKRNILTQFGFKMIHVNQILNADGYYDLCCHLCEVATRDRALIKDVLIFTLPQACNDLEVKDGVVPVRLEQLCDVVDLLQQRIITSRAALLLLKECISSEGIDVRESVTTLGLEVTHDVEQTEAFVKHVLKENQKIVTKLSRSRSDTKKLRHTNTLKKLLVEKSENKYHPDILFKYLEKYLNTSSSE